MRLDTSNLRLAPSDLSEFLSCRHRTGLDLAVASGVLDRPHRHDPMADALGARGAEHERAYVASLRAEGLQVVEIDQEQPTEARIAQTLDAMRSGADVIVQAALSSRGADSSRGWWFGYADVLQRVPVGSDLGDWSYEPYDAKLARETRGGTILQLAVYVDLLEHIQRTRPTQFWVVSPGRDGTGFTVTPYRDADYSAYVRLVRRQLGATLALDHGGIRTTYYPEPVEHCEVCRWWDRCNTRRRSDDHLGFIAGIGRVHRDELVAQGFPTLADAATRMWPIAFKPGRGSRETYERIHHQARLQLEQRQARRPVHELLPVVEGQGLARLPAPSPGDLFLDLEGARFARAGGREYLFGVWGSSLGAAGSEPAYEGGWAFDDGEERVRFEAAIDRILQTMEAEHGAHVYHFGHYEPTAFKRLMGRYATRATELDELLRGERFVDLYAVVRQALRAGVESYSIKQLEPFYGFARAMPLEDASAHLQAVELALEGSAHSVIPPEALEAVRAYNEDDCRSTEALRDWLEGLRAALVAKGMDVSRPTPKQGGASEAVGDLEARQEAARARLLEGLSPEAVDPDQPEHPYWLLAHLLDWHRREDKAAWWEFFRLRDLPEADLFDEPDAIAGLVFETRVKEVLRRKTGTPTGSVVDRYRYPVQEVQIGRRGDLRAGGDRFGTLVAHDRAARTVDVKKGPKLADVHPTAVFQFDDISAKLQQEALLRFCAAPDAVSCGTDLLFRRRPRLGSGELERREGEEVVEHAVRLATDLDRTTLAVQGPPGSGKTYVGARMISALVRAGKKVGVVAVSHKVIRNLLNAVHDADAGISLGHRCDADDEGGDGAEAFVTQYGNHDALDALASGDVSVLGGTAWLWSREEALDAVDVLFVDEAGQMSLANALAVSGAASSLVLLGDPQQLEQPQKGSHPDGVGVSALEHVLGDEVTIPEERGLFLPTTWRLHPAICAFTSEVFYADRLKPEPGLERQRLVGTAGYDGAGLWWVPVEHSGNQNVSDEEVDAIERIVGQVLAPGACWEDRKGVAAPLTSADLRVVAPYNAQVNRLTERLAARGVPVGTVDKFQGQEAPVVIYSMTTSTPEDAPRGMAFLYSLNRLNVATSRARCTAIVVASPRLLEPACRTPQQMRLANALCRYRELARPLSP